MVVAASSLLLAGQRYTISRQCAAYYTPVSLYVSRPAADLNSSFATTTIALVHGRPDARDDHRRYPAQLLERRTAGEKPGSGAGEKENLTAAARADMEEEVGGDPEHRTAPHRFADLAACGCLCDDVITRQLVGAERRRREGGGPRPTG